MEFKKFSARGVKANFPITAIRMHKTLCQDILFDLSSSLQEVGSYKFSRAYFYDFYKILDGVHYDNVYVLDGVELLHRYANTDKPLVKDRALYSFLYLAEDKTSTFAEAILTNPWLNNLCNRPLRLLSERVSVIESVIAQISSSVIYSSVLENLDSGFTPRGVWGLDYMFAWKSFHDEPKVQINDKLMLIPLTEYINTFSKE